MGRDSAYRYSRASEEAYIEALTTIARRMIVVCGRRDGGRSREVRNVGLWRMGKDG